MPFQVNIAIDDIGLKKISDARQCVTLVKSAESFVDLMARGVRANQLSAIVAWQVFQPLESNVVTWNESYSLYATTTPLDTNNIITLTAVTNFPAVPGWIYTFTGGPPNGSQGVGSMFKMSNQVSSGNFSFGLAQIATVNGSQSQLTPLNAAPTLYNQTAQFTPTDMVSIFLSSCSSNGTVIPGVSDNALVMTLSSASPTAKVGFDDATNTFFQT